MNRRTFLIGSSAAAAFAQTAPALSGRIGISSWSFHNFFSTTLDDKLPKLSKSWDLREFPAMIADRYHVHQLEMVAPHFESTKLTYVREVKSRLERAHSHLVNIPVDIPELSAKGGLSDPDSKIRETAITACAKWMDIAQEPGGSFDHHFVVQEAGCVCGDEELVRDYRKSWGRRIGASRRSSEGVSGRWSAL